MTKVKHYRHTTCRTRPKLVSVVTKGFRPAVLRRLRRDLAEQTGEGRGQMNPGHRRASEVRRFCNFRTTLSSIFTLHLCGTTDTVYGFARRSQTLLRDDRLCDAGRSQPTPLTEACRTSSERFFRRLSAAVRPLLKADLQLHLAFNR